MVRRARRSDYGGDDNEGWCAACCLHCVAPIGVCNVVWEVHVVPVAAKRCCAAGLVALSLNKDQQRSSSQCRSHTRSEQC